ncbi:MAG: murein hydrolase activator EnvC family protein [Bacillota bacterium]|jgi:murein DD-endopeptidase MepM/ murein hydrolase activator NlpD
MTRSLPKRSRSFTGRKWKNKLVRQFLAAALMGIFLVVLMETEAPIGSIIRQGITFTLSVENDWTPVIQETISPNSTESDGYKMVLPVSGIVEKNYGWNQDLGKKKPEWHGGIGIKAQKGEYVKAATFGVVERVHDYAGKNNIYIRHGKNIMTVYGDLGKIYVKPGQQVKEGESIGEVGSAQVYFEIRVRGATVDPLNYLRSNRDKI